MSRQKEKPFSADKEASINPQVIQILRGFPKIRSVDFSALPNIAKLFEVSNPANIEVNGPHKNLFTSENLYKGSDPRISGVWYQKINGDKGIVAEHDHSGTKEHEILIFWDEPGYANIPIEPENNKEVLGLSVVFIPAGIIFFFLIRTHFNYLKAWSKWNKYARKQVVVMDPEKQIPVIVGPKMPWINLKGVRKGI